MGDLIEQHGVVIGIGICIFAAIAYNRCSGTPVQTVTHNRVQWTDQELRELHAVWLFSQKIERKDFSTGGNLSAQDKLSARTIPNERLKITFGIDNAFTTDDQSNATMFINEAKTKLQKAVRLPAVKPADAEAHWQPLIGHMRDAFALGLSENPDSVNLATLVQFVTLKVSLLYLFDGNAINADNNRDITFVAERINHLWLKSKTLDLPTTTESNDTPAATDGAPAATDDGPATTKTATNHLNKTSIWMQEKQMHASLRQLIPKLDPTDPRENPMNYILPAYETMWQVVYRGILEIYFRERASGMKMGWKKLLSEFLSQPSEANWKKDDGKMELSALNVIAEILRLYPPTRRIYRQYPQEEKRILLDLETLQRGRLLAGDDGANFRPNRWLEIKEKFLEKPVFMEREGKESAGLKDFEERLGFMPFAKVCPAGKGDTQAFGWKMIALLIATLLEGFDKLEGNNWELWAGGKEVEFPQVDKALESGREDYLNLVFEKSI